MGRIILSVMPSPVVFSCVALVAIVSAVGPVRAAPPPLAPQMPSGPPPVLMPLSDVRPGMEGEALTVFSGTKPEPFKMKVVSVVRNFGPKQDIILMRAMDPRVEFSGIAAGMSGSPVYIGGKLVGAVAYAWSFSKEPLAGVTPIEAMLAERARPRRVTRDRMDLGEVVAAPGGSGVELSAAPTDKGASQLRQVSVPLSVTGLSGPAMEVLSDDLRPFGLVPMRAGGGAGSRGVITNAGSLMPGATVGVQLIKGDMSATAMGTVTWISGKTVLAFGHPMFGSGEVSLPMVTGEVHAFVNSQASSFKLASPLMEVGALVQDRPSCIIGDLGLRATMMPVAVSVSAPGVAARVFRAEVARSRSLLPRLTGAILMSAIADAEPDVTEMAVHVVSHLNVHGLPPIEIRDTVFSTEGVSPRALMSVRGLRALGDLFSNPFEPVRLDSVSFDVRVEYRKDQAEIIGIALPGDDVRAGAELPIKVSLRPYAGREYEDIVKIRIPERLAGQTVRIEVASGTMVRPDLPRPENLADFVENMRHAYTASSIVVSVSLPDDGASLRGRLLPHLPAAALDTLRPGKQTRRAEGYRLAERTVAPSPRPVMGKQEILVQVRDDVLGSVARP